MKVLFDHSLPFSLAHGGFQLQIEQTKAAMTELGVEVECLRWWDDRQRGDLIHFFGRPPSFYIELAHKKGLRVVMAELLTGLGSRGAPARLIQRWLIRLARAVLPPGFTERLAWNSFQLADAVVALTPWEARLMQEIFQAPPARIHVVPNGVENTFLERVSPAPARDRWLICTATITERKRVLELAEAAVEAQVPVWIVGQPYAASDPYAQRFARLVAQHAQILRCDGPIQDRARLAQVYREARGFVLLSTMESLSLSALEAAACECPLLLSDLPWAHSVFGNQVSYCPIASRSQTAEVLRRFHAAAPSLQAPPRPLSWTEVARTLQSLYEQVLSTSR